jgi:hypothetical protein
MIHIVMKGLAKFAFTASLLSAYTDAIQLHRRTDGPPRVVGFPVQRKSVPNPLLRDRVRRRSETVQATLDNEVSLGEIRGALSHCWNTNIFF